MNNIFSFRRFGLLLKKTIAERPLQTVGVIALLLFLTLMMYGVVKKWSDINAAQTLTFIWGLSGGGFFLASLVFNYFGTNASGSSYLTLPASYFEKWLCGILIAGIFYPLLFVFFYHLIDMGFVTAYHNSLDPGSIYYKEQYEGTDTFELSGQIAWRVYAMFFMFTGAMFTGSLFFNKMALLKTGIVMSLVFIVLFGLNSLISVSIFPDVKDAGLFHHVVLAVGEEEGTIVLPSRAENIFHYGIAFIIPAILWITSLTRLKEKEF